MRSRSLSGSSVSIVLNVHREAQYVGKTLMSIATAVDRAVRAGVEVEMVVVFDRSDARTIDAINAGMQKFPCRLKFINVDNGNLALSRNDGNRRCGRRVHPHRGR